MSTSRTQRPLFNAFHIIEGLKSVGVPWPKDVSQEHFFAVICSLWISENEEFSQLKLDSKGVRVFKEFADSVECFHKLGYQDFMESGDQDIEVMLIQYNRGNGKVMHSKILFP